MTLEEFNALPPAKSEAVLLDCCGCSRWVKGVTAQRPFENMKELCEVAEGHWEGLERDDWLEAFGHHPQIGEKAVTGSESHRRWSEGEQKGTRAATEDVKTRLTRGNRAYLDKFGHIFLVCATGKSAEEILALLEQRLQNDPARELPIAAEQQRQISRLRLQKLFASDRSS
jgi:OHCU decarboxylase